ncbi:hypothetical protein B0I35DRAFT_407464 [Stachybotrys elegans]|uniref:GST N-terminal domain-containing protein n=1 Tax=Stachybotrys elegans TaxID=80388 RepID=A0A8K0SUD4_9HYPO|nr:hypothetical protein B0I35DRAFT_407464 [Stachybotrys elegans]
MASGKLVLFDIPSREPCKSWSPNTLKTRLALNFKGIDYETEWIEYPDIAPKLAEAGVSPQTGELAPYTLPAVRLPSGKYVMNSASIITELEALKPTPPLIPNDQAQALVDVAYGLMVETWGSMRPLCMNRVARQVLNPASVEHFETARAERFGMSLAELEKKKGGEEAWAATKEGALKAARLLKQTEGPFFAGTQVTYADLVYVGCLQSVRRVGEDLFQRLVGYDESLEVLYNECKQWVERDSY